MTNNLATAQDVTGAGGREAGAVEERVARPRGRAPDGALPGHAVGRRVARANGAWFTLLGVDGSRRPREACVTWAVRADG